MKKQKLMGFNNVIEMQEKEVLKSCLRDCFMENELRNRLFVGYLSDRISSSLVLPVMASS